MNKAQVFSSSFRSPVSTLLAICGSRYNAFVPERQGADEPCRFFRLAAAPAAWRPIVDDETEHWDGLA